MRNPLTILYELFFPPRIADDEFKRITDMARRTTDDANRLADKFESIEQKAIDEHRDPLAILIREVKSASFKRATK